jgi:hypothetical protein
LYYLNARYYDSKIARFLSEDTYRGNAADPFSLNLYTYCSNNPIMYIDPSGHLSTEQQKAIDEINDKLETTTNAGEREGLLYGIWRIESGLSCLGTATGYTDTNTNTWVIEGGGTVVVGSDADYDNINVSGNSNITVNNNGVASSINVGAGSNTTVNNGGIIGTLYTGANSITTLNNSGITGVINSGAYSSTTINNYGMVGVFNTGAKSTNDVNNYAYVVAINTGLGNHTYIGTGGYVGYAGGNGTIIPKNGQNTDPRYDYIEYMLSMDKTGYTGDPEINKFLYQLKRGAAYSTLGIGDAASVYGPKAMQGLDDLGNATMSFPFVAAPFKATSAGLRTVEKIAVTIEKAVKLLSGADEISGFTKAAN